MTKEMEELGIEDMASAVKKSMSNIEIVMKRTITVAEKNEHPMTQSLKTSLSTIKTVVDSMLELLEAESE